jgi:F-type H+-transporting ATPase subunit delta
MSTLKIARRYAKSVLETAIEHKLDDVVATDLATVESLGASSADFRAMMRSPIIDAAVKLSVLKEALGSAINPLTMEFLKLIINKGRGDLWREIVMEYRALLDDRKNVERISVTSAVELGAQERSQLESAISARLKKTIVATYATDPSILGGAVIRVGDQVLDGSIRHQLHVLKDKLAVA